VAKGFVEEGAVTWARQREEQVWPHLEASTEQAAPLLEVPRGEREGERFGVLVPQVPNW